MKVAGSFPAVDTMDTTTLIGVAGAAILLIAFIANEMKKLTVESFWYDFLNLVGAALLAWYAILLNSIPFLILEGIWALVSLRDVIKNLTKKGS